MSVRKTILVTGGAGFIGSHLCERLARDGHRVISLDNYFTGSRGNHVAGVEYREGHTKDIETHVPEGVDIIYHLGEYSRVEQSVLEPEVVSDLNTLGTGAVVRFWRARKSMLVYAGSSTKFGDGGKTRDTSPYARTKAENSELVGSVGESENLPYAVAYFYNVYGPRERSGIYGTVIEQFKRMYLAGAPCSLVAPGTQKRNFTHVLDIVSALVAIGERGAGEYGIGNERAYAIREVADFFGFADEDIILFPERPGNRMASSLDAAKTRALGWSTTRELPGYIAAFRAAHARGVRRDTRVLVYSTTMHPVAGLVEDAFLKLAQALPAVSFDVVTARFSRMPLPELAANVALHRVGFGIPFDKYLLPLIGPLFGIALALRHRYLFAWSLMASYAALAAILTKPFTGLPLLVTLGDQDLDDLSALRRQVFGLLLSRADQVYGTHGAQEARAQAVGGRLARNSLGEGDAFANALRFAYADIVRKSL